MADRSVLVRLRADTSDYTAKFVAAGRTAATAMDKATSATAKQRAAMDDIGRAGGIVAVGAGAALAAVTKAAIDWETAWAGVNKTVDGTETQMAALEDELRTMATELPATHTEIAAVAEAAGQLGVAREDITDFTRTMIDLGETTNLSADEAATSIARFTNIMGTPQDDVDRLGSALVDLGNNSATTEAEILELGTRLSAAGAIAGLSESDVLAFGATLTSVGVEAEAGGTAMSKVFTSVRDAALEGGENLETFAQVSGTTAEEFRAAFAEDPAQAINMFIQGLGRMNEAGQSTSGVFEALKLTDQRLMRALLSTAEAGDLLTNSLATGNQAWEENTALADEAEKRYETAAAQMQVAWNQIKDAAIDAGGVILPMIADLTGGIGDLIGAFANLPGSVQKAVVALTGLAGLAGGGLFVGTKMVSSVQRGREALANLGLAGGETDRSLGTLARGGMTKVREGAGRAAGAFDRMSAAQVGLRGGAAIIGMMTLALNDLDQSSDRATRTLGEFANIAGGALLGFGVAGPIGAAVGGGAAAIKTLVGVMGEGDEAARQIADGTKEYAATLDEATGAVTEQTEALILNRLEKEGTLEATEKLGLSTSDLVSGIAGDESAAKRFSEALAETETRITGVDGGARTLNDTMESGDGLWGAAQSAAKARDEYGNLTPELEAVSSAFGIEKDALAAAVTATERKARANDDAGDSESEFAAEVEMTTPALEEQEKAAEGVEKAIESLNALLSHRGAQREYEASVDAVTDRLDERKELINEIAEAEKAVRDAGNKKERNAAKERVAELREELEALGKGFDTNTEAGRANEEILDNIAASALGVAEGMHNADKRARFIKQARKDFENAAVAMGMGREEARKLARQILNIEDPAERAKRAAKKLRDEITNMPDIRVKAEVLDGKAKEELAALKRLINSDDWRLRITARVHASGNTVYGGVQEGAPNRAMGGPVPGYSPHSTADNIPLMATAGEYVHQVKAVDYYGHGLMSAINNMQIPREQFLKRANGGPIPDMRYVDNRPVSASVSAAGLERQVGALAQQVSMLAARGGGLSFHGDVYARDLDDWKQAVQKEKRSAAAGGIAFGGSLG